MTERIRAADDADVIGRRMREIRAAEDAARAGCQCAENALGEKHHALNCPLRDPPPEPAPPAEAAPCAWPAPQMLVSDILRIVGDPGRFLVVTERAAEWPA